MLLYEADLSKTHFATTATDLVLISKQIITHNLRSRVPYSHSVWLGLASRVVWNFAWNASCPSPQYSV